MCSGGYGYVAAASCGVRDDREVLCVVGVMVMLLQPEVVYAMPLEVDSMEGGSERSSHE